MPEITDPLALAKAWRDEANEPRFPAEEDRDAVEAYDKALIRCADELTAALTRPPGEGREAVLTNPYTGTPRDYRDVESDPTGVLIVEPGAPIKAAPPAGWVPDEAAVALDNAENAIRAALSAAGAGVPAGWVVDRVPQVAEGESAHFWIAVRRASGKVYTFPATYCNRLPLLCDDPIDACGPGWSQRTLAEDENDAGDLEVTGWYGVEATPNCDYDTGYSPVCQAGDEVLAWHAAPAFAAAPPAAAQGDGEMKPLAFALHAYETKAIRSTRGRVLNHNACMERVVEALSAAPLARQEAPAGRDRLWDAILSEINLAHVRGLNNESGGDMDAADRLRSRIAEFQEAPAGAGAGEDEDEEALCAALRAYNRADYAWTQKPNDDRDEPRHRFAMRAAIAALHAPNGARGEG